MKITEEEYRNLKRDIITEGKKIYEEIKNKYAKYLLDNNKISLLEQNNGEIIIDEYNEEDIKLFGGINKVPPGHGGRRKQDNKIHIYPYSYQLNFIDNIEDLKKVFINDIIIHEMFHFYAQPDMYDNNDLKHGDDVWFGHRLTEGIVQKYTEIYIDEHHLAPSYTTYKEEVLLVDNIMNDLKKQGKTEDEINSILLNDNQIEIIKKCKNGEFIKKEFIAKTKLHQSINNFLRSNLPDLNNNRKSQEMFHYYMTTVDVEKLYGLKNEFPSFHQEIDTMFESYRKALNENKKTVEETKNNEQKSFDYRTPEEIQTANKMKEKNKQIREEKHSNQALDKPKVLVKTNSNMNGNGFASAFVLSLLTGFAAGVIFMIVYMIISK